MRLTRSAGPRWDWLGSRSAAIRLGGHSHMLAFRYALELLDDESRRRVAVLDVRASSVPADDSYWPRLAAAGTTTAIVWGGNQHSVTFMLSAPPFTIVRARATTPPLVEGRVVPYRMVMALWGPSLEGLADFVGDHPDPGSVVVVGTPPPKPEEQVRSGIAVEPFFVELLAKEGFTPDTAPVTPAATRVAAWEALQDAMEEISTRGGARFLGVPPAARTAEGTLRPEFCEGDATHANPAYGVLMWHHLIEHAGGG